MAIVGTTDTADTTQLDELVALAVERTYQAFAAHRLGESMTVHRTDVSATDVAALGGPVRLVPAAAIDRWLPHATSTWGTGADLRALVPRVLDLFASGSLSTPPEVLFAKLRRAGASGWTLNEQATVEGVVTTVWLATLASDPPRVGHPAWRLLVAMAELGGDLAPFLDDWTVLLGSGSVEGQAARRHRHYLTRRVHGLADTGLGVAALFWSPCEHEAERLERWLHQPAP